jgi:DNA (cytosine-5)-methyltransferase 1
MRLLDLFCGAGGAAMGYYRAGFAHIVGVDHEPQPNYPFEFVQADALDYLNAHGHEFDLIHASPPCQAYSKTRHLHPDTQHPDLVPDTRRLLQQTQVPYVIENVPGAPLHNPVTLCGLMFGLPLFRHRLFETHPWMLGPPHPSHNGHRSKINARPDDNAVYTVAGHSGGIHGTSDQWRAAMGIDWMTASELTQAIPPAYTEWIGRQMLVILKTFVPSCLSGERTGP